MITTGIILSKNGANSYNVNIPDLVDGDETFNSVATVCSSINNIDRKLNIIKAAVEFYTFFLFI